MPSAHARTHTHTHTHPVQSASPPRVWHSWLRLHHERPSHPNTPPLWNSPDGTKWRTFLASMFSRFFSWDVPQRSTHHHPPLCSQNTQNSPVISSQYLSLTHIHIHTHTCWGKGPSLPLLQQHMGSGEEVGGQEESGEGEREACVCVCWVPVPMNR